MRYRLRTLLMLVAILPPLLAVVVPSLSQWLAPKPLPVPVTPQGQPVFAMYSMGKADATLVLKVLTKQFAGTPKVRMSLDAKTGELAVLAPPSVHQTIQVVVARRAQLVAILAQAEAQAQANARSLQATKQVEGGDEIERLQRAGYLPYRASPRPMPSESP